MPHLTRRRRERSGLRAIDDVPASRAMWLRTVEPAAMANGAFNTFASALEGVHNSGDVWVGGSMGSIATAPADPVFWMHHAEIDRIWAEWQGANPDQNPTLLAPLRRWIHGRRPRPARETSLPWGIAMLDNALRG